MTQLNDVLASTDAHELRKEMAAREEEIRKARDSKTVATLNDEITKIRQRIYQLIGRASKGRISYFTMPALA